MAGRDRRSGIAPIDCHNDAMPVPIAAAMAPHCAAFDAVDVSAIAELRGAKCSGDSSSQLLDPSNRHDLADFLRGRRIVCADDERGNAPLARET